MLKIDVLDKGFVEVVDSLGSDLTVVNSARVSFGKRKKSGISQMKSWLIISLNINTILHLDIYRFSFTSKHLSL